MFIDNPIFFNAKVHVIGVGTSGQFAVDYFLKNDLFPEAHYTVMNTNAKFASYFKDTHNIVLGQRTIGGLGTGGDTKLGSQAIEESRQEITELINEYQDDIVVILGGVGRGTGSTAIPVISQIAREAGAIVLTFLRTPFKFEGTRVNKVAEEALNKIRGVAHGTVALPSQYLVEKLDGDPSYLSCLNMGNEIMAQSVNSVLSIISEHGHINIDFNDLKSLVDESEGLYIGEGKSEEGNNIEEALIRAVQNPLVKDSLENVKSMIVKVTMPRGVPFRTVEKIMQYLNDFASDEASVKVGASINEEMREGELQVQLVAGV